MCSAIAHFNVLCQRFETGKPKKTLFIKNLPSSTNEAQIKALSPDILSIRLESSKKSGEANPKSVSLCFPMYT